MKNNANVNHRAGLYQRNSRPPAGAAGRPLIGVERSLVRARGMTLIELMAVLAVAVILVTVAVPGIGEFIRNARMVTQTNEFVADLAFARSEAIKRSGTVVICKSTNPTASTPSCNTTGENWSTGWVIFVDDQTPNNGVDAGEEVLRVHAALESDSMLFASAGTANFVAYTRMGLSSLASVSSFALCDQRGAARGRLITLEVTGRPTIGRDLSVLGCDPA